MNWRDPRHSLAGGAEIYAWELARALVDAGAKVEFVTARERGAAASEVVDGITVRRRGSTITYYAWALLWLLVRRRRLDLVVDADCGIPVFSPLVLSPGRTAVVLLVHHVHLDQFHTYFPSALALLGRFLEGTAMPRVYRGRVTVAVSSSTQHEMVERLGWREPIHVIHNGNAMPVRVRDSQRSTGDRVAVLGRLAPHKRVDEVVRAVGALREARPSLHLDVIGKGPDHERLERLVGSLGLQDHVTLHGYLPDEAKRCVLDGTRLHVCASDVEGWGQVVIEAAALGIPTVARDVPGMRESIHAGVTGWLLPEPSLAQDPTWVRLAEGIDHALAQLEDPERRREMAVACEQWAAGFTWTAMHASVVSQAESALALRTDRVS